MNLGSDNDIRSVFTSCFTNQRMVNVKLSIKTAAKW